ncbi:MAG: methylated-DNA--protein-cysteine methyltransferase [Gemmatimonadetes bacterium]|nr:methylated-DNA--protein-cysteine methyltransferase [Gemmatimonadota bacterium]
MASNPNQSCRAMLPIESTSLESPIGKIAVAWRGPVVLGLEMPGTDERGELGARDRPDDPALRLETYIEKHHGAAPIPGSDAHAVPTAVASYFDGNPRALEHFQVEPSGTAFQRRIWSVLREIPCGETWTYGQVAERAGRRAAARATGGAIGANPCSLFIPCHRVVGAEGELTGFGGGLDRKIWLLQHESAIAPRSHPPSPSS